MVQELRDQCFAAANPETALANPALGGAIRRHRIHGLRLVTPEDPAAAGDQLPGQQGVLAADAPQFKAETQIMSAQEIQVQQEIVAGRRRDGAAGGAFRTVEIPSSRNPRFGRVRQLGQNMPADRLAAFLEPERQQQFEPARLGNDVVIHEQQQPVRGGLVQGPVARRGDSRPGLMAVGDARRIQADNVLGFGLLCVVDDTDVHPELG